MLAGLPRRRRTRLLAAPVLAALTWGPSSAGAEEVWTGLDVFFEKAPFADWTDPSNQDAITDAVRLTRKNSRGLFNVAVESGYQKTSPADTEWATGSASEWATLEFQTWVDWVGGIPPETVGVDAVLHLISEDVYLDIRFESWSIGNEEGGGGFAYRRAAGPASPTRASSWSAVKARGR